MQKRFDNFQNSSDNMSINVHILNNNLDREPW